LTNKVVDLAARRPELLARRDKCPKCSGELDTGLRQIGVAHDGRGSNHPQGRQRDHFRRQGIARDLERSMAQGQPRPIQDRAVLLRVRRRLQGTENQMPRRASGPRLWFDKKRGTWTILDGRSRRRTGFTHDEARQAEKYLGEYIASKHVVKDSATPFIADVLAAYATEHLAHKVSGSHILYDIRKLGKWWGEKRVAEINAKTCRAYVAQEGAGMLKAGAGVPECGDQVWHKEHGPLTVVPVVVLTAEAVTAANFMTRRRRPASLWLLADPAPCPVLCYRLVHGIAAERDSGPQVVDGES
jgi:hypothetical protein